VYKMVATKYQIRLDNFEGPLDLLLHLIEKNEIDIYDIPIAKITEQYLSFINEAKDLDLDIASEFLVMAATLLSIKARMLLPKPVKVVNEGDEEGKDPREELVVRLLEYKKYKEIANLLKSKEQDMAQVFTRDLDLMELVKEFGPYNPVENISVYDLLKAFQDVWQKVNEMEPVYEIARENISIKDCMNHILDKLAESPRGLTFSELFSTGASKLRVLVTFLGILELIKLNKISFQQKDTFGKIIIFLREY